MRLINTVLLLAAMVMIVVVASGGDDADRQVMVNGRVATLRSVVVSCDGDTVEAARISTPLPVRGSYLSRPRLVAEHAWNSLRLSLWPLAASIAAFLLIVAGNRPVRRVLWELAAIMAGVTAMRWWLTGTVPLTTGADTLQAIALFLTLAMAVRTPRRSVSAAGCMAAAVLSGVAAVYASHPAVVQVNPALLSSWLPVHVGLMMAAYSIFILCAVAACCGPVGRQTLRGIIFGEILLAAGIITGSVWAASAWGRYWAWDPKETWALVTSLVYLALIAAWPATASRPAVRRVLTVVALAAVIFTWWGVNRLGGLHAY